MVAERGGRLQLLSVADSGGDCRNFVAAAWFGDADQLGKYFAGVELGHGEFLVANCICVYRLGVGFNDERGDSRSSAHFASRSFCGGGAGCAVGSFGWTFSSGAASPAPTLL